MAWSLNNICITNNNCDFSKVTFTKWIAYQTSVQQKLRNLEATRKDFSFDDNRAIIFYFSLGKRFMAQKQFLGMFGGFWRGVRA